MSLTCVPPPDWVVVTVRMPQLLPAHPLPLSAQERVLFGLEPGTGVKVATMAAVTPVCNEDGATICRVNELVKLTAAELCFEGSATLVATTVTPGEAGRVPGAVKMPEALIVPHAEGHAGPARDH